MVDDGFTVFLTRARLLVDGTGRGCGAEGNAMSGFFFCVRATRITVHDCHFANNATGVSIGTRDCYNSVRRCISSSSWLWAVTAAQ